MAALSPSLDLTYVVRRLRFGEIHRPTEVVRCAGGKPLNMARAASTLGADVELVAVLGGPTGQILQLHDGGGRNRDCRRPHAAETRTCVSIAAEDTGTLTEVYEYAAPIPPDVWEHLTEAVTAAVQVRPGWLSISGGPPKELAADAIAVLVGIGHNAGVSVAVDTHGPALPAAVEAGPELVKINRYEAADLLDLPAASDLRQLAQGVRDRSGGVVVITDGAGRGVGRGRRCGPPGDAARRARPVPGRQRRLLSRRSAGRARPGRAAGRGPTNRAAAGVANALVPGPGRFERSSVEERRNSVRIDPL